MKTSRRDFMGGAVMTAAHAAAAPSAMPAVRFGEHEVSRLIIGSNPFYGYLHYNRLFNDFVREYMTPEKRIEILRHAEQAGIRTWQVHYSKQSMEDFQRYRSAGGKMNWFLLGDFEMMSDFSLIGKVAKEFKPIGIAHHGNRTDERFERGEMQKVRDFCKAVRDAGVLVGVSAHNPAVFETIEGQDWDVDYYQACFYNVSRSREQARKEFGEAPVDAGGMFMERDPERVCKILRQTSRPCLAFKILAGGRADRPQAVRAAFRYAFENIKPADAVIVGMCPKFRDEIAEDIALTVEYGATRRDT